MTVQYIGGGIYHVHFNRNMMTLSEEQIKEIQNHDFMMGEVNGNIPNREELLKEVQILEKTINGLNGLITELTETNSKLENMLL